MWLTRIWIITVASILAGILGIALILPQGRAREITQSRMYKLDHAQHNAHLLLMLDARTRIDAVSSMANDLRLKKAAAIASTSKSRTNIASAQHIARAALNDLIARIEPARRPELVIALDVHGKEVTWIGKGADHSLRGKRGLKGYPLVAAALRGLQRDDSWSLDGHIYLMSAAPLVSSGRDNYVGALLLGKKVDEAFVKRLQSQLVSSQVSALGTTDVAYYLRGKVIAATKTSTALRKLPLHYDTQRADIEKLGRSAALSVGQDDDRHLVVMAPVVGEANTHDAFYALIGPPELEPGLFAALGSLSKADISTTVVIQIIGTWIAMLAFGFVFLHLGIHSVWSDLLGEFKKVASGESSRIAQRAYPGLGSSLVQTINEAFDRSARRINPSAGPQQGADSTSNSLAIKSKTGGGLPALRASLPGGTMPPLASENYSTDDEPFEVESAHGSGLVSSSLRNQNYGDDADSNYFPEDNPNTQSNRAYQEGLHAAEYGRERVGSPSAPDPILSLNTRSAADDLDNSLRLGPEMAYSDLHAASDDLHAASDDIHEASDVGVEEIQSQSSLPLLEPIAIPDLPTSASRNPAAPAIKLSPTKLPSTERRQPDTPQEWKSERGSSEAHAVRGPEEEDDPTLLSSVPAHLASALRRRRPPTNQDESSDTISIGGSRQRDHYRDVFDKFVALKKECLESIDNLTYERFAEKLDANRANLIARYACEDVHFRVYQKDGKAALKASPISNDSSTNI